MGQGHRAGIVRLAQHRSAVLHRLRPADRRRELRAHIARRGQHGHATRLPVVKHHADVAPARHAFDLVHHAGEGRKGRQPHAQQQRP